MPTIKEIALKAGLANFDNYQDDGKTLMVAEFDVTDQVIRTVESAVAELYTFPPTAEQIANETAYAWISVDDKLPGEQGNDSEEILCFLNGHCNLTDMECRCGGGWGIRLGYYDAEKGMFRVFGRPNQFVTHWMPLPKPPAMAQGEQGC